ncbi:Hsp20/alpha crystallin family protein [Noviherbaspirillum cavernae]|uniref:Hsp20/alpha crystallin family protein n=1 Tax=Noviherbaspirillum cavernae TaxID=2320862 RepID=A0A418WV68_9BURK|nr:Hsp20/alpha crystallin family protein [Noviherbaspirillum cavernae]RJF96605.1 Hsp20/alpha crystallin family protein [Noviherbaspirillum cavernae]
MNIIRRHASPLSTYRPASMDDSFGRMVENMFEDFLAPGSPYSALSRQGADDIASPRLTVTENDKSFEVEAEMPGVKKEDIKVAVENQRVSIEGEAKRESAQKEGESIVYAERITRHFARSFTLPSEVDESAAQARLENGILMLSLPKKRATEAKKLTVQ